MASTELAVEFLQPPPGASGRPKQRLHPSARDLFHNEGGACVRVVAGVLSEAECTAWVEWAERNAFEPASHGSGDGLAHRDCSRLVIDSAPLAAAVWARVGQFAPRVAGRRAVGCLPTLRVYRYDIGQQFAKHIDASAAAPSFSATAGTEATVARTQ